MKNEGGNKKKKNDTNLCAKIEEQKGKRITM